MKLIKCKQCGRRVEQRIIDEYARRHNGDRNPPACARCFVGGFDALMIDCGLEPLFPDNWQTVRPEKRD